MVFEGVRVIPSWKVTLGVLLIYRFARTKSKPLANILMIYSNKKIKSCNAKWRRERERQKKISRSNEKKKKQLCTSSTLFCAFLCRCFALLQRETSYLHILRRKCRKCSPNVFLLLFLFAFFHCRSFSPGWPLAFLILSPPIFMFSTNAIRLLCFCLTL